MTKEHSGLCFRRCTEAKSLDVDLLKARRSERNFTLVVNEWEKTRHSLNIRIHFLANLWIYTPSSMTCIFEFLKYSTYIPCHLAWIRSMQFKSPDHSGCKSFVYVALSRTGQFQGCLSIHGAFKPLFVKLFPKFLKLPVSNKKSWTTLHDFA